MIIWRSLAIAFSPDQLSWRNSRGHSGTAFQARLQLRQGRPLGHLTDFTEQVIGKRLARQRRARFEPAVQRIGHVADLIMVVMCKT